MNISFIKCCQVIIVIIIVAVRIKFVISHRLYLVCYILKKGNF